MRTLITKQPQDLRVDHGMRAPAVPSTPCSLHASSPCFQECYLSSLASEKACPSCNHPTDETRLMRFLPTPAPPLPPCPPPHGRPSSNPPSLHATSTPNDRGATSPAQQTWCRNQQDSFISPVQEPSARELNRKAASAMRALAPPWRRTRPERHAGRHGGALPICREKAQVSSPPLPSCLHSRRHPEKLPDSWRGAAGDQQLLDTVSMSGVGVRLLSRIKLTGACVPHGAPHGHCFDNPQVDRP